LSFFDEADEPQPRQETRRPRTAGPPRARSGRPPGGSGRPPGGQHQQEVQTRRLIAAGVIVVIVIAMALLIKSCDSSATDNALKKYNANVYKLVGSSVANAQAALGSLATGTPAATAVTNDLDTRASKAQADVTTAQDFSVPGQMTAAQAALISVLQLRAQALTTIATDAAGAASKGTSKDAVNDILLATSQLYASDVNYITFVTIDLAKSLNAAGITPGTAAGSENRINAGQVIQDLGWLNQTWIADKIGAKLSTTQANANNDQPGLTHGDQLDSTTVDGQTLVAGQTYTIPAADAQTWALGVTDGGQSIENDVGCSIKIQDQSDIGTATIPTLAANGGTGTCTINLPSKPETGPYTVTATVDKVPGETNLQNNSTSYTLDFTSG
jgi:hypothetical protein